MVVDDDPGTCTTLKNILIKKGYEVGIAYTGEEAITMAQERASSPILARRPSPWHRRGPTTSSSLT